jgi:hypothetical protein
MVRALPAAIKRSISLPKASDDTDESLSLAAAGFGHLAVAAVVRDIAAHPLAAAAAATSITIDRLRRGRKAPVRIPVIVNGQSTRS